MSKNAHVCVKQTAIDDIHTQLAKAAVHLLNLANLHGRISHEVALTMIEDARHHVSEARQTLPITNKELPLD